MASAHLNEMNPRYHAQMPWQLTSSFARAIEEPGMEIWKVTATNVPAAQNCIYHRAQCDSAARQGTYTAAMEIA
jgi:fructose-bisphosphate aldolase class I